MTSTIIERAVVRYFDYRKHIIVANTSWGVGLHECDLLALTRAGYGIEIEVKVSRSDIIADKKKPHHRSHGERKIKQLYFAIPRALDTDEIRSHIPAHAGIIVVDGGYGLLKNQYRAEVIREAAKNRAARAWTQTEVLELARLGAMRYWYRHAPLEVDDVRVGPELVETP